MILHGVPARYSDAMTEPKFDKRNSFYIFGGTGTGKTYLACSIINISKSNHGGKSEIRLVSVPSLVMEYRNIPFADKEELIKRYSMGMVIFDDIGAEYQSEFSQEFILMILDSRWNNQSWTGFTSNLSIDKLPYGDRIKSRIAGIATGNIHNMDGKDRRLDLIKNRSKDNENIRITKD